MSNEELVPDIIAKYGGAQKFDVLHQPLLPPLYFASENATRDQVSAAFNAIDKDASGTLDVDEITNYLQSQGYGESESKAFFLHADKNHDGRINFEEFMRGFAFLNALRIQDHGKGEDVTRKPASCQPGASAVIRRCDSVTVAFCETTSSFEIADCTGCKIVLGPCKSTVVVDSCSGCTISAACHSIRIRQCDDCTFFLYTSCEPIIERSDRLRFAPFNVSYPGIATQFRKSRFDASANLWWAVYDADQRAADERGKSGGSQHWSELPAHEIELWDLSFPELGPPEPNPVPSAARGVLPSQSLRDKPKSSHVPSPLKLPRPSASEPSKSVAVAAAPSMRESRTCSLL